MDTAIAIRTAVIKKKVLHIQAGAGIVADSIPENEWDETMNKGRAIFKAVSLAEKGLMQVKKMLLMIDNYDSFTYNLVQYFGELDQEVHVYRNDKITIDQIKKLETFKKCTFQKIAYPILFYKNY